MPDLGAGSVPRRSRSSPLFSRAESTPPRVGLPCIRLLGYGCEVMPGPFVDDALVAQARGIASQVIDPVFDLIRRHTTVSVERTVLRLFGMSDAGPGGVPLTNLMTDRLKAGGVLNRGAAYWYGRALQLGAASPLDAVEDTAGLEPVG